MSRKLPSEHENFPKLVLVLGGSRSGKSRFAEKLVSSLCEGDAQRPVYIATAQSLDEEMATRIDAHKARRDAGWQTIDAPLDVAGALDGIAPGTVVLLDCLTLWLSNLLLAAEDCGAMAEGDIDAPLDTILDRAAARPGPLVCVSNEVGMGLVPETALGRRFRDMQGRANQAVAARADLVVFVAAGLPLVLKGRLPHGIEA